MPDPNDEGCPDCPDCGHIGCKCKPCPNCGAMLAPKENCTEQCALDEYDDKAPHRYDDD